MTAKPTNPSRGASLFFDFERFLKGPYCQDPAEEALSHLGTG